MLRLCRWFSLRCLMIILLAGCTKAVQPPPTPSPLATASPALPTNTTAHMPTLTLVRPTPTEALSTSKLVPTAPTLAALTSTPSPTLATPTTQAVPSVEVVVDNQDATFATTGTWFIGDGGQSYNGDCAWAPRGIQNIAYVRPELPMAGAYEVFAWWCGDPNHDQSERVLIQIYQTVGRIAPYQVYVNLQENAGQWNSLGTYYLQQNGSLSVAANLDGNIVADAFRFVYYSPEYLVIRPTPLPTRIPWTGHPPTPLEQLTSGDLSARLGLVQRFYPYTPIISMQEVAFDDCQAFPRDGCSGTRDGWRVQVQYQDMLVTYRVSQDYRLVALEASDELASRQLLYLFGMQGNRLFRVDRYPDDTWHLSGSDLDLTYAAHLPLDAATVGRLHSFLQTYSSVRWRAPDGMELRLYGLGQRVELSQEDQSQLVALAAELAEAAW